MQSLASILTVLVPLAASAQTLPAKPFQPPSAELELVYLLTFGDIATQRPGEETMKVKFFQGGKENGTSATFEISKIGHCHYQVLYNLSTYSKIASTFSTGVTAFDFSKAITAAFHPEDDDAQQVMFSGPSGIVSDIYYIRGTLLGEPISNIVTRTEEEWSLSISLKHNAVNPEAYRIAAQEFSSRFCNGFKLAGH